MSDPEPGRSSFARRHPVLITLMLVFGLGFVSGAVIRPTENLLLSGLITALAVTAFFLVLTSLPAFLWTVGQSIRNALRVRSDRDGKAEPGRAPFHRRFMHNLDAMMQFIAQGLTP